MGCFLLYLVFIFDLSNLTTTATSNATALLISSFPSWLHFHPISRVTTYFCLLCLELPADVTTTYSISASILSLTYYVQSARLSSFLGLAIDLLAAAVVASVKLLFFPSLELMPYSFFLSLLWLNMQARSTPPSKNNEAGNIFRKSSYRQ